MSNNIAMETPLMHAYGNFSHHEYSVGCLLYTSPSPRDVEESRMPSSA